MAKRSTNDADANVTLQTIADALGVSKTTISNAYSRPDQLAPALREKILCKAKEFGYSGPNPAARSLRKGRTGAIGLLVTTTLSYTVTDPAAVMLLQGFARVFDERGLSLLTLPAARDHDAGIEAARSASVDGFLTFCKASTDPRFQAILERALPTVVIDGPRVPGVGFVGIDDRGGARMVAQHVAALGHRRVGILSLPLSLTGREGIVDSSAEKTVYPVSWDRLDGFADAFAEVGIDWNHVPIYECADNTREDGARGAGVLLDRENRPTAILATADLLAFGAIRAAQQRGLSVPGDLTVTGFDDVPDAQFERPSLTTIRQPLIQKGEVAARFVVDGWEPGHDPEVILPTELIVRASSGPVRR